jgi:hypothetical protein
MVFPIFHELVNHLSDRQDIGLQDQILIVISVLHGCHRRLLWVAVAAPFQNRFVAHLVPLASRVVSSSVARSSLRLFRSST